MRIVVGQSIGLLGTLLIAGVMTFPASAEEGNIFTNLFRYGGTTVPNSQPKDTEPAYCPPVDVFEGGSNLRTVVGANVRTQTTLGRVARECTKLQDGSVAVKVGIEARVLLGPAGSPGRFDVPASVVIKNDEKVVTSRNERTTAIVEPGEAQGFAQLIVDGLIVPPAMANTYEIEVGLGAHSAGKPVKAKTKVKPRKPKPTEAQAPEGAGDAAQ